MRKIGLIFILFIIILSFLTCDTASSQDNDGKVYMTSVVGEVDVGKIDSEDIEDDDTIGEGWFIKTGENSSAILYINDLVVKINQNSLIEITKSKNDYVRFNLKYGSIKVDSRQTYEDKDIIVDAEDKSVQTEEPSTMFELDFDSEKDELDYNVNQGTISITSDEVKIYVNTQGVEKIEPIENDVKPDVDEDEDEDEDVFSIPDYEDIFIDDEDIIDDEEQGEIEEDNEIYEDMDIYEEPESLEIEEEDTDNVETIEEDDTLDDIPIAENSIEEEKPESIDDVIDKETLDEIEESGMDLNKGLDPPDIQGKYLVDDLYLVYDSKYPPHYFDPGYIMKDYIYTFYDQTDEHNIKVQYQAPDNPGVYGGGDGAFISGSGNKFTIYLRTKSKLTGAYLSTMQIISGEIVEEGIENMKIALIIMGKEGADVHNIEMEDFPPIGTKRIIISKSIAERIE